MVETLEQALVQIAELESKLQKFEQKKVKPSGKTVTLINEGKTRIFDVDASNVVKVLRGAHEAEILRDKIYRIVPGSIVTFTEEFAKFLLTYKEFKVYGII